MKTNFFVSFIVSLLSLSMCVFMLSSCQKDDEENMIGITASSKYKDTLGNYVSCGTKKGALYVVELKLIEPEGGWGGTLDAYDMSGLAKFNGNVAIASDMECTFTIVGEQMNVVWKRGKDLVGSYTLDKVK